jgi:hypothetical protein
MDRACAAHCCDLQLCSPVVAAPIVFNPVTELARPLGGNSAIKTYIATESQKSKWQDMLQICQTMQSACWWGQ